MKNSILLIASFFISFSAIGQNVTLDFTTVYFDVEMNSSLEAQAKQLAISQEKPTSIYIEGVALIEAKAIENGQPVYMVTTNLLNPKLGGTLHFYDEIVANYDLDNAQINMGNGKIIGGKSKSEKTIPNPDPAAGVLIIPESTNDRVMAFDRQTGDLINADFIPADPGNLSTPIAAIPNATKTGNIYVSDQIDDAVHLYDPSGNHVSLFAPAGGVNTSILDNIRGIDIRQGTLYNILVAVGGGANDDAIAEMDAAGNFIGNFIANGAGGLDSPFDIHYHEGRGTYLVTGINSDAIHEYDINGNYLGDFANINNFPEQITELANGNVLVGNFSGTQEGIVEYDQNGTLLGVYDPAALGGYRGVYELGNGNLLVTNGGGVHEVSRAGGGILIQTKIAGVSARFIHEYDNFIPADPTISQTDEDGDGIPDIADPCACGDPLNILDGGGNITHFHDFVLVVSGPGETWEISAINSGAIFTAGLVPIPVGTVLPEIAPGVYRLDLYHPTGVGFNVTVDRTAGGGPFPLATGGTCDAAICGAQAIPTMGEWGLIILALLLLTFATVFMMGRTTALAGYGTISNNSTGIPFNKSTFGKTLMIVMVGLAVLFAIAVSSFGYEMTTADVPGSLIAGPILAYLLHLLVAEKD